VQYEARSFVGQMLVSRAKRDVALVVAAELQQLAAGLLPDGGPGAGDAADGGQADGDGARNSSSSGLRT
jgi:hypothetical protein